MDQRHRTACGTMPVLALVLLLITSSLQRAASGDGESQFAYNGFAGASLALDGAALVAPNGLLVLTNGTVAMTGHALHPSPLRFRDPAGGPVRSFSASFAFAIVSPHLHLSSHGMAFFVSPTRSLSTTMPFQYLGLLNATDSSGSAANHNHVLAVELDTVLNYEFDDLNNNHVGVDVDSLRSVAAADAGYYDDAGGGAFRNLSLFSREAMRVWVDYDGRAAVIDVTLAPLGALKPTRPLLSRAVDLSAAVPAQAYVGFSASTGVMACSHYVLGWSFGLDGAAPPLDVSRLPDFPRPGPEPSIRKRTVLAIVLPVAAAATAAIITVAAVLVRRQLNYFELRDDWEAEFGAHRFSYRDLLRATAGFADKNLVGKGGCGEVYRGALPRCKTPVAVKRVSDESSRGAREFIAEVASMGRLRHRNLVPLLGYCRRKGELLLVYKYMPNGSLEKLLHDDRSDKATPLGWDRRFRVIKDVASGLLYLHEEWEQVIVHRDVKPSNVLLDDDMVARLGDFGLARLYDRATRSYSTRVVGTTGYLAPELMSTGKASPATDVFAFGAFLLEVVCGRSPVEQGVEGESFALLEHVLRHWQNGSFVDAVDARLQGKYDAEEVCLALKLGLICVHPQPSARPSMRLVVQCLDGGAVLPELLVPTPPCRSSAWAC